MPESTDVRILGPLEVRGPDGPVELGGPKQRAVLAALVLTAGVVRSIDALIDDVWGEEAPATAVRTLQAYVSNLRRALEPTRLEILTRPPGYLLEVPEQAVDAAVFERLLRQGRRQLEEGRYEDAGETLRHALALWRGPALSDLQFEQATHGEARRLEALRLDALECRIEADLRAARTDGLAAELETLVGEHPLREPFREQLMRVLHAAGRRADALRVYREGRETMVDELGIEPRSALQELEVAILREDQPAAPAARAHAEVSLPTPISSLVGREDAIETVSDLLAGHRLVTLMGAGGVGKTRLAVAVGHRIATRFPDGVAMAELGSVGRPEAVLQTLAAALPGGHLYSVDSPRDLAEAIAGREMLLVVDNCEQVAETVGATLAEVLNHAPGLRCLATSQLAMEVPGERRWRVPSLDLPPEGAPVEELLDSGAVSLFVDRARAVSPHFDGSAHAATIAGICRQVDGIPLAIELAASRSNVMGPAEVLDRLRESFDVLRTGAAGVLPRHRSLRTTIEWSFGLLVEDERILLERLTALARSFDLELAQRVCAFEPLDAEAVGDLLGRLVDRSLVVSAGLRNDGSHVFQILEAVRRYGWNRLESRGVADELRRRHAAAVRERVRPAIAELHGAGHEAVIHRLDADEVQIRTALAAAREADDRQTGLGLASLVWPYWEFRHRISEGRSWLATFEASKSDDPWAVTGAARLALMAGAPDAAVTIARQALERLGDLAGPRVTGRLLTVLAESQRFVDRGAPIDGLLNDAVAQLRSADDTWAVVQALRVLALDAWDRGEIEAAAAHARACLDKAGEIGDLETRGGARLMLGSIERQRGALRVARELLLAAAADLEAAGDRYGLAQVLVGLGHVAIDVGAPQAARERAADALRVFTELGDHRMLTHARILLADVEYALDDPETAEQLLLSATRDLRRVGDRTGDLPRTLRRLAWSSARRGDLDEALRRCREALRDHREEGRSREAPATLYQLGTLLLKNGQADEAQEAFEEAAAWFDRIGNAAGQARCMEGLAAVAHAQGRIEAAQRQLQAADTARERAEVAMSPGEAAERARIVALVEDGAENGTEGL